MFGGLSSAASGLRTAQQMIQVYSHNVANAATPGYSRQRPDLVAIGPGPTGGLFSKSPMIGMGVDMTGVTRLRDVFLDARAYVEHAAANSTATAADVLGQIEDIFPEPSDSGIAHQLQAMWTSFHDLSNNPGNLALRNEVLAQATTLTSTLHSADTRLVELRQSLSDQVRVQVPAINSLSARIAELNVQIKAGAASGGTVSDLQDERDMAAMQLADMIGAAVRTAKDGTLTVSVGGTDIVSGASSQPLVFTDDGTTVSLRWGSAGGPAISNPGGKLGALMDGANTVIPHWRSQLDGAAAALVSQTNALHSTGFGSDGVTGRNFFDASKVTAATIALDPALVGNPAAVAAGATSNPADGDMARRLAALGDSSTGPDGVYHSMVTNLGVAAGAAATKADVQRKITDNVDERRDSASGVNIDEELAAIVQAQHAYAANAKVIAAVNDMLDALINIIR